MAGVITHIYIADLILKSGIINVSDKESYFLGSISPDAIMSKENYQRDDKKISHLRDNISSDRWYQKQYKELFTERLNTFYRDYVLTDKTDFSLGYYIHLLTDQAFHYSFRDDIVNTLKKKELPYQNDSLKHAILYELDTIDYSLLDENKWILDTLKNINKICMSHQLEHLISSEMICKNFQWINQKYTNKTTPQEPIHYHIKNRKQLYNYVIMHITSNLCKS